ncbi:hypothetical protein PLESTB_000929400 [Pleodorina starrii]|uniref:Pre-mRNA-splicing factor cwc2 n=1 Tax=Pleodorina starrii TaxID=330485 RepID=A0A9W6BN26_9CHLO|nr:hypothetical protein PLESTM_001555800 [Pleodorina starrii]GLC54998.1 hypothetical protein PLESTB_000929400 [Pleodorina starrii]GLC68437.1 hypothetical protein PLESTF_000691500 [Pleodorina starrii]
MNPRDPHYPNRAEWLTRPARKQVDDATLQKEIQARGGVGERNLWSGRRVGPSVGPPGGDGKRGGPGSQRSRDASKYRCVLELDVGRTRGSDAKQHVFCLYFAKGCCSQGSACTYLHRLPTAEDEAYAVRDLSADIFGREKRTEAEGYRSGAGTLDRDNRTLYVNYEGAGGYELPKIRQLLDANFRAFGPINNIYIVHHKTIAFVRYDWRSSAEFAKEAIHKQGLVGSSLGEVITARWANEDPNPVAVLAQKRACEEAFGLAVMSSFDAMPPEQKQARIMELQLQSALQRGTAIGSYPATDDQFAERERQQQQQQQHEAEAERLWRQQQQAAAAGAGGREAAAEEEEEEEEEDIPYIPPDIYEEQQRLLAQRRAGGAAAAAAAGPQGEPGGGPPTGDFHEAAGASASASAAAAAGAGAEAPEWERAWQDPELREQMRANPELRERMRRARNEAVYWSAYQAHYTAYAGSYGHHVVQEQYEQQLLQYQQQGQGQGQGQQGQGQQGEGAKYSWEDYYAWYGQQQQQQQQGQQGMGGAAVGGEQGPGQEVEAAAATEAGVRAPTGYGVAGGPGWGSGPVGFDPPNGQPQAAAGAGQEVGGAGMAAAGSESGGRSGAEEESGAAKPKADGLSLLGAAYGSDEEEGAD